MNEFIISFRESLEAALIVGIILTVLYRNNRKSMIAIVWVSVVAALVTSVVVGLIIYGVIERSGSDAVQALLEGIMMYITAVLLFYVIFWMKKNMVSKSVMEGQALQASDAGKWGLFLLVFFAIVREGFETAIFLVASTGMSAHFSYFGFFSGIALAIFIGYLIVARGRRIPLKKFFSVTSLLLVFFAAGMVAYGTHEIHEFLEEREKVSGVYDDGGEQLVYDIFKSKTASENPNGFWYRKSGDKYIHILNDNGRIGVFFKGLFGYNSNPIWHEVILWFLTLVFGLIFWRRMYR